ncbi:MAG: GNAT family N-acetyltransferase [Anaerolineae bacterium]|nr:GNAT family N-acetyltransferase [Anaerolineae bacterium]
MIRIEGTHLHLRDLKLNDLAAYAYWLRPEHEWQRLNGPYYSKPTPEQIPEIIDRLRKTIDRDDPAPLPPAHVIIAQRADDALLGKVNWYWISQETLWLAAGIVIYDPASWRKGLGYEALGLWTQYLFDQMPEIARLDLRTWSGNTGMMRLAQKLGYQEEARFRKARIVDGTYYDGLGYGILREEWTARYPAGFAQALQPAGGKHERLSRD